MEYAYPHLHMASISSFLGEADNFCYLINDVSHDQGSMFFDEGISEKKGFFTDFDLSNGLPSFGLLFDSAAENHGGMEEEGTGENINGGCDEHCSLAGAADPSKAMKQRRDRSKTIVSERKRRGRMKEKLYELRSLVPNISKMDKASIIADAIVYVQGLQRQAKRFTEEIAILRSSSHDEDHREVDGRDHNSSLISPIKKRRIPRKEWNNTTLCRGKMLGVMAHEVGDKRFYIKIEFKNGGGVASSLYHAIESLSSLETESINFSCTSDRYICSLTVNGRGFGEEMNLSTMKFWIMGALLKEGFQFDENAM
ncbi:Transcription factor FER-LIKE IRON DEFICIENCY-INDUCED TRANSCRIPTION FACTOR [Apostasia shenzhenica]|uniref:Transcription factor FER-LIKE IRON DEFICIENCY-INDUCED TRANSCRIPTION FACTOR n=1 Tax=Apostasia shenzhenica TaxID=1088818 RepID=A0A2I0AQB8_9ASPA|nr:Transcription factor FER-LIKE IRON DEFICIENCY-INDUCED TRANSCRIPTION FACTOR [Apostasia shenzhenica]